MSTKVIMPQMGESIFEGTITKWLKKVGERVGRDEPLFEISTDKVDSEIPSPAEGILTEILVPEGKTVQINTVVAVINGEGAATGKPAPAEKWAAPDEPPAPPAAPRLEVVRPAVGAAVPAAEIKIPEPAPAPPPVEPARPVSAPIIQPLDIRTSPLVRRMAREHNIDLSKVRGTGLEGRITKQDILDYVEQLAKGTGIPSPAAPAASPAPEPARVVAAPQPAPAAPVEPRAERPRFAGETEVVPMTQMRKSIAEHMVFSKHTSAHVHTVFEVDLSSVVALREKYKDDFEKREGIKLTFTPFFVKALVDTVREFPIVNASVSDNTIVYKKPVNVGVAVALDNGLIVPVVRDAHLKSFTGIALAINDLADRARTKRLKPDDVQNGTISITNPGSYGALFGTPIINQPQVAILGVGGIEKRVIVINDAIAIRPMVYLSLSFDHRIIDGAVADQFMARLKSRLQSWTQWID
ncbi:MAG TPA: dihydrolipoamide acetyltransferase family protein [Acidobacteriota bacterium]|nr:dihydrolipoamide acetyltransferase family protein [Acidobacteriota bacterium]